MRLFLGSFATVYNLTPLQKLLANKMQGRWVKEQNRHVTLQFLGDRFRPEEVIERLGKLPYPKGRTIIFDRFVFLGREKNILALTTRDQGIRELHGKISRRLFGQNGEGYLPHVSLLRIKSFTTATCVLCLKPRKTP